MTVTVRAANEIDQPIPGLPVNLNINLTGPSASVSNEFLYRAERYEAMVCDAYYLRARWYSQRVGRFLNADRHAGIDAEPSTLHRYAYALPNPISFVDPSGYLAKAEYGILIGQGIATPRSDLQFSLRDRSGARTQSTE